MRSRSWWLLIALAGCGRFGFGSSTDGGPADSASGDASDASDANDGTDGPVASKCGQTAVAVCDGFETPTFDSRWMIDTQNGTDSVDPTFAYRGSSSAHFVMDPITSLVNDPRAELITYAGMPITGTVYLRAWMFFKVPFQTTNFAQFINFADDPGNGISFGTQDTFVVNNDYTSGGYAQSTVKTLPLGTWTCIQFEMPSGTVRDLRAFIDGNEVTDITIVETTTQPAPTHLYFGIELVGNVSSYPGLEAWADEVILDDKPTTCDE